MLSPFTDPQEMPGHQAQMQAPIERWRHVCLEFHCIQELLVRGTLPHDFEPVHLTKLRKGLSPATRGVLAFLLHVWNADNRFDLGETRRWDEQHLAAFQRWVSGRPGDEPCHYF